ncbi:unnamed protein product [Cyclocybe aegerita]|uniref:T6SS Phospholipase effector Tle1-like catalytic domain-containing protein n=1 Tax=Cyclocybe aegerita TaxID=1973307 RepID=A0A8S0WYK0_CYCAE|nr:unnamed protein product [Cyclocybe aegerita]
MAERTEAMLGQNGSVADSGYACTPLHGANPPSKPTCSKMPCGHTMGGRNLIVCIDGTSNQFGDKNTNVIELYNLILKAEEDQQHTWYNSGIGTYAQPSWKSPKYCKKVLRHKIDLAVACDFEKTVLGSYEWLSDQYRSGDCIFLFGFSRGAFQVRVLSAMIEKVGLIHRGNKMQIPFAYELYADSAGDKKTANKVGYSKSDDEGSNTSKAERFKSTFSRGDVKVHFVGAWDTVSSIGIVRGSPMLPGTVDGMGHVCYFRHALALDERRVKFLPEFAYGGTTLGDEDPDDPLRAEDRPRDVVPRIEDKECSQTRAKRGSKRPHTKEVWFAGTHSDIGGGNVDNAVMNRGRPPLRWMVFEAGSVGLRMAPFRRDLSSSEQITFIESLTWPWWPFEFLPFKRLTFNRSEGSRTITWMPHLGAGRKIHPGQKIHSSLLLTDKQSEVYTPKARPPERNGFWEKLRKGEETKGKWLEVDLHEIVKDIVDNFAELDEVWERVMAIAPSAEGKRALYSALVDTMAVPNISNKTKIETLDFVLRKLSPDHSLLFPVPSDRILPVISRLSESEKENHREIVQTFTARLTTPCLHVLEKDNELVFSVAYSPDGTNIASGSWDGRICLWDAVTGTILREPFEGQRDPVKTVAFSPDGKRIASGSDDQTIRIWDAETGSLVVVGSFKEHTGGVNSVAFSPDGSRIVSGSSDGKVRIWEAETVKPVGKAFRGHTAQVWSVAFFPDGKRVVSGSFDKTVRIWDAETGNEVGKPLQGHTDFITSVAISPDGSRIVSGAEDKTIWIWDAMTGEKVVGPIRGHTGRVWSVAFSPDGQYIVSGSRDKTVRIWDAETGKQVGEPLRGHTESVWSVASSPDGKRVASGSRDCTVRIWDVETWVKVARLDSVEKATGPQASGLS